MKKVLSLLCVVCLGVVIIFAGTVSYAKKQVVLEFPSWYFAQGTFADHYAYVISVFEKENPGVKINGYAISYADYPDKTLARAAAGNLPDLLMACASYSELVKAGCLEPLNKWMDKTDIKEAIPFLKDFPITWTDGKTYKLSTLAITYQPVYLTWVYEESGVDIPTSPEEFTKAMEDLTRDKDGDGLIDQYGIGTVCNPGNFAEMYTMWSMWVISYGGTYWVTEDGEPNLDDPKLIKTIQYVADLYKKGYMPKGTDVATYRRMLGNGAVATGLDGPFVIAGFPKENWPYFSAYSEPWTGLSMLACGEGVCMAKSSEYKEEAWKFIEVLSRKESQENQFELTAIQPARQDAYIESIVKEKPWWNVFRDAARNAITNGTRELKLNMPYTRFMKLVTSHIEEVLFTDKSAEDAMKDAQKEVMDILSKS